VRNIAKIKYRTQRHQNQKTFEEFEMKKKKEKTSELTVCTKHLLFVKGECPYCKGNKRKVVGGF